MAALYRFTAPAQAVAHPPQKQKKKKRRNEKKKSLKPVCGKEPLCKAFIMAELPSKWLSGNHQSFLKVIQWFPDSRGKKKVESFMFTANRPHRDIKNTRGGVWLVLAWKCSGTTSPV